MDSTLRERNLELLGIEETPLVDALLAITRPTQKATPTAQTAEARDPHMASPKVKRIPRRQVPRPQQPPRRARGG